MNLTSPVEAKTRWYESYFFWMAVFAVAVFGAYANVYRNAYLLDDEFLIQKNEFIRSWSYFFEIFKHSSTGGSGGLDSFYRPLQIVAYLVANQILGYYTESFHFVNVLFHYINAVLLFCLGTKMGLDKKALGLAVLLWAVHPVHTEAVTYMSATADSLHTLFCLSALLVMAPNFDQKAVLWSVPFFICGLLSKEAAIVLPALACACIYFFRSQKLWVRDLVKTWPLWLIAVIYLVLRKTVLNFDDTFQFYKISNVYTENIDFRFYTFLATIPNYILLLIWPHNLHHERSFPVFVSGSLEVYLGAVILLLMAVALWIERNKSRKIWSLAILWILIVHVPQSGVLIPVNSFFLEHWMYFVSMGAVLLLGDIFKGRAKYFALIALPLVFVLAVLTWKQNERWANPITFYNYVLSVEPRPPARLFNNLGMAYADIGENLKAKENYERGIKESDNYPQTHHNLGLVLLKLGMIQEAKSHFEAAIRMDRNFYHSYPYLVEISKQQGDEKARGEYMRLYEETKRR